MSWRTVVITQRCKLEYKLGYLIIRGEDTIKVFLPDIGTIIVESTAVALTAVLLSEIIKNKINLIFCDEKHNPESQLLPFYGSFDVAKKVRNQTAWSKNNKELIWTHIVREKIKNQATILKRLGFDEYKMLMNYINQLQINDNTNREGHAAKVYFNCVFGKAFTREQECSINGMLNYGYAIILSAFNREIVANGYLTQVGLFHSNQFNKFNLSSDLMEPFRVLVDDYCIAKSNKEFNSEAKHGLVNLLNLEVKIDGKKQVLKNAISIYCKSVFLAIETGDASLIKFYEL